MKKRIFSLLFLILSLVLITSCQLIGTSTKYNITYYVDGEVIEHTPSSYEEGKVTKLNPLDNDNFEGWYLSETFEGNPIVQIEVDQTGDISLYAKMKNDVPTPSVKELEDALNDLESFAYNVSYVIDGLTRASYSYEFYKNSYKAMFQYEDSSINYEYLAYVNDVYYYYGLYEDGTYYSIDESNQFFSSYIAYLDLIDLSSIDTSKFMFKNGQYILKDSKQTSEVANDIFCTMDKEYTNLAIELFEGKLYKLFVTVASSTQSVSYEVSFSNHNKVEFTLPNATPLETVTTIAKAKEAREGESVTVTGSVSGIVGNNFYIQDETGGIYIYCGNSNDALNDLAIGTVVTVTGVKETYKGLAEIKSISSIEIIGDSELSTKNLETLKKDELDLYVGMNVSFQNFVVTAVPQSFNSSSDNSFTISDGTNTTTLFVSKHLNNALGDETYNLLASLNVGDVINVSSAVISYFNKPQVAVTANTVITLGTLEATLVASPARIRVKENTSFEEAIKSLVVTFNDVDGTSKVLSRDEYTLNSVDYKTTEGEYEIEVTYNDLTTIFVIVVTTGSTKPTTIPKDTTRLEDIIKDMGKDEATGEVYGVTRGLPSIGNPKVLVIPISFTDYPAPSDMVNNLERAFFGDSSTTGWESLSSYYQKSSYGKLNIEGTVLPVFQTGKEASYYDAKDKGDYEIIQAALKYYDKDIDYSEYDSDKDGYIDSIYLVYTCEINRNDDNSMWWAYTYEYFTDDIEKYDNVEADFYLLAGYDFLTEIPASGKTLKYNLETFIHETGHLLGLDDYYDTDTSKGPAGGLGGGDMMDYNVGDHNPFSKAILGWVDPLVMGDDDATVTLRSFGSTGDCLIIAKNFNNSLFTEYFIIDFYTPDGLNQMEAGYSGLFSKSGIRIYHIDATPNDPTKGVSIWDVYKYNNSSTDHRLISLVEADGNNDIEGDDIYGGSSSNSDLFQAKDVWSTAKWYDGSEAGFILEVVSINNSEAVINISFK